MKERITTDEMMFRDPAVDPPPIGPEMLLLTPGGRLITGRWMPWCVGWAPMPKVPAELRARMCRLATGGKA